MPTFNNIEDDYITRRIEDEVQKPRLAKVLDVTERTREVADSDKKVSNIECTVKTRTGEQQLNDVPIMNSSSDMVSVPQIGDTVVVIQFAGRGQRNVIIGTVHTNARRAPLSKEGDIRFTRGSMYFEMDGRAKFVRIANKFEDDATTEDANSIVEIKFSDGNPEVTVKAPVVNIEGGDVTVNADSVTVNSQNVKLGDSDGDFKPVARKGDGVNLTSAKIAGGSSNVESS